MNTTKFYNNDLSSEKTLHNRKDYLRQQIGRFCPFSKISCLESDYLRQFRQCFWRKSKIIFKENHLLRLTWMVSYSWLPFLVKTVWPKPTFSQKVLNDFFGKKLFIFLLNCSSFTKYFVLHKQSPFNSEYVTLSKRHKMLFVNF
jgi:hypothetical protein